MVTSAPAPGQDALEWAAEFERSRARLEPEHDIIITQTALFGLVVCVEAGRLEDLEGLAVIVECLSPAGTSGGWQLAPPDHPQREPVTCDAHPERRHVLLSAWG